MADQQTAAQAAQLQQERFNNALVGQPGPKGGNAPIYDPVTKAFIGWQKPDGTKYRANSSSGYAPDYYQGTQTSATGDPAQAAAQTGGQQAPPNQSYLTDPSASSTSAGGRSNMTWQQVGTQLGLSQRDIDTFTQRGITPDQVYQSQQSTGDPYAVLQPPAQDAFGIKQVGSGQGYSTLQNSQGQQLSVDSAGNYFSIDSAGNHVPVSDQDAQKMGFQSANPETNALKQLGQIDPTSEALRTSLGKSYADTLSQAQNPTAGQYQSYLDLFKQVDPQEYAQRQGMATSMDKFLGSQQAEYDLGSQLDPVTQMQVEQQARKAQAARGNLYGSGQAAVEAMTTGQAGQALKQQRMTNLQQALGGQQSYLSAGLGLGDTAMQLYQQGLANKANAAQGGMSYLSSGQTPYQAGASYLANAEGTAGSAAQGGPQYNPASLGTAYSGSSQTAPQYGLEVGNQAQNYYNSLNNSYGGGGGGSGKNQMVSAGVGALSGAASGAAAGSVVPGWGTAIGAVAGGLAGGLQGYYS